MTEMLLVIMLAGRRAALPAVQVNAVVELAEVTPVPRAARHVAGLAALRSRPLTVIDCTAALGIGNGEADWRREFPRFYQWLMKRPPVKPMPKF